MNLFDAAVTAAAIFGAIAGFTSGLLRSLATILAYLLAAPFAVAATPQIIQLMFGSKTPAPDMAWLPLLIVMITAAVVLGILFRAAIDDFAGSEIGLGDRIAGAALGVLRIALVAVLLVAVFDRLIPADRQPPWLVGSRLRPYLSAVATRGLQSLPPEIEDYIDRLKRERGLGQRS